MVAEDVMAGSVLSSGPLGNVSDCGLKIQLPRESCKAIQSQMTLKKDKWDDKTHCFSSFFLQLPFLGDLSRIGKLIIVILSILPKIHL